MNFNKWWLLPIVILAASAWMALTVVIIFGPSFVTGSSAADCTGASASDYACHQERYQNLVRGSGVGAAFDELKGEYEKNDFVKVGCHQLTHVIGRAAADLYGDLPTTYAQGDEFCGSGYYHGAMEVFVAKIGTDKMLAEVDMFCANLGGHQEYSAYHRNCAHGLGHGFMGVLENELFESLEACDVLTDEWEGDNCYDGVFMQNTMAEGDPNHPSKYLRADRPLYPCTDVETRYKNRCYQRQTGYALKTQGGDFARVFDLCSMAEDDFRAACYQGLGRDIAGHNIQDSISDAAITNSTSMLCTLGEDDEARSNCVIGAAEHFIRHYHSDEQAKKLCEFLDADLRTVCFKRSEEYYKSFQT